MARSSAQWLAMLLLAAAGCTGSDPGDLVPPTADQDPKLPQRTITVAGNPRAIHTETFGNPTNPALFLLHDRLVDYRAFQPFRALSDRYFVVMWDQRGNGLSQRIGDGELTPASIVEEIDALKAIHSPNAPISLIGHGFGASYAALYMSQRPASVDQAVLMEPFGLNGQVYSMASGIDEGFITSYVQHMLWETESISATDHETLDYRAVSLAADGGLLASTTGCTPAATPFPIWRPGGYAEIMRDDMLTGEGDLSYNFDFAAGLNTFPAQVRILVGDCSPLDFNYQNTNNRPLIQHADIVVIRGAGHRMFLDQPDLTIAAVKDYLSEY